MSDAMDSTRSSKYFPLPDIPIFDKSALTPSLSVLATHPKYRDALRPYEGVQWEVVQNMADLFNAWEDIAERYVNVDPAEDTEVDIMTGDTLYKGEKIEVEEDEDESYEDEISSSDEDNGAGSRGDAHLGHGDQAEEDDELDELGFWGPESGIELQFAGLPDLTALTTAKGPSQAEVDAFLCEQSERTRLQEESVLKNRLASDDYVEDEIIVAMGNSHSRSERPRWRGRILHSETGDAGSPLKKRRIHDIPKEASQQHASGSKDMSGPSSDGAQICSDAVVMDLTPSSPFRTPKRAIHRARRGRPSNPTSASGRAVVHRYDDNDTILDRSRLDYNLVQSETITPYISRSSRIVKQPRRLGIQIPWSQLRKLTKVPSPGQNRRAMAGDQPCFVELPDLPADWLEYSRRSEADPKQADSPIAPALDDRSPMFSEAEVPSLSVGQRDITPPPASVDLRLPGFDEPDDPQDWVAAESLLKAEADSSTHLETPSKVISTSVPQDECDTQTTSIREPTEATSILSSPLTSCPPSPVWATAGFSSPRCRDPSLPAVPRKVQTMQMGEIDEVDEAMETVESSSEPLQAPSVSSLHSYGVARSHSIDSHDDEAAGSAYPFNVDCEQMQSDTPGQRQSDHLDNETASERGTADQAAEGPRPQSPPPIYCKFEAMMESDDDPLNANTMDTSLDELNSSTRRLVPLSVWLPVGAKGAAFDNPILIDDDGGDDELGGWDDVGW